jgi:hypothetical protein
MTPPRRPGTPQKECGASLFYHKTLGRLNSANIQHEYLVTGLEPDYMKKERPGEIDNAKALFREFLEDVMEGRINPPVGVTISRIRTVHRRSDFDWKDGQHYGKFQPWCSRYLRELVDA